MRPDCLACALKHVSQAIVLMLESYKGYEQHKWLAIGHLAEAEDELVGNPKFRRLGNEVREYRLQILSAEGDVNLMELIALLEGEYNA